MKLKSDINRLVLESLIKPIEEANTASGNAARLAATVGLGVGGYQAGKKAISGLKKAMDIKQQGLSAAVGQ